jgi:hypothetical protein
MGGVNTTLIFKENIMTPENFCYWLQGKAELHPNAPTKEQWQSILEHLDLVMTKVTPPVQYDNVFPSFFEDDYIDFNQIDPLKLTC